MNNIRWLDYDEIIFWSDSQSATIYFGGIVQINKMSQVRRMLFHIPSVMEVTKTVETAIH